jgi:circadian clock protein KaiC
MERISTGNAQADLILDGGFSAHSISIVMGQPGSGKTVFSKQLAFANLGARPVLYLTTLSEPLPKVLTYLQEFDFTDVNAIGSQIVYESVADTVTTEPQKLPERLTELVKQYRPRIIVFDSFKAVGDLMPDLPTWRKVLYDLAAILSAYDATTFWIGEYIADMVPRLPEFAVADGIIELTRDSTARGTTATCTSSSSAAVSSSTAFAPSASDATGCRSFLDSCRRRSSAPGMRPRTND